MEETSAVAVVGPCRKCGSTDRASQGRCRPCANEASRRWSRNNPGRMRACVLAWQKANPQHARRLARRTVLKRYNLTLEQYDEMLAAQGGVCAVCKQAETSRDGITGSLRRLAVDHCHRTGVVRGLLCWRCNSVLGRVYDSRPLLLALFAYLGLYTPKPPCPVDPPLALALL